MPRPSFKPLACSQVYISTIYIRILWVALTCAALRFLPLLVFRGYARLWKSKFIKLDKFIFDLTMVWQGTLFLFCRDMSLGALIAVRSTPKGHSRVPKIRNLLSGLYKFCIINFIVCLATYRILESRGFDIIAGYCEGVKPEDMASLDLGMLCHHSRPDFRTMSFFVIIGWKCVGLAVTLLAAYRLQCARLEETELKAKIERDVQEDGSQAIVGLVNSTREKSIDVEDKI